MTFNLSEKREEARNWFTTGETELIRRQVGFVFDKIEKQDKEFIKLLKEFAIKTSMIEGSVLTKDFMAEIDKLAGKKLK